MLIFSKKLKNRNSLYILLLLLIGLFFTSLLFTNNFYISHDGQAQVVRIAAYAQAITEGQIPPRWAGNLNYGYGLPTLNFFFPLEGYLGTVLYIIGVSFENSFKILIAGSFILSFVFYYLWLSKFFKKEVAFAGAIFYGLSPYHFLDIYVRGQLAEMLALMFVPLLFLFIENNLKKPELSSILVGGMLYGFLILSHSVLSLIFTTVAFSYIVIRAWPRKKLLLKNLVIIAIGLMFAIYFWFPALYEGIYINSKLFVGDFYKNHFANLKNLFYSPWGFGSVVNSKNGLSPQIGPFLVILSLISTLFYSSYKQKRVYLFFLFVFLGSIFMSLPYSSFIWSKFHLIQQFQFPWRFTAISSFSAAILSAFLFSKLNKKSILVICTAFILFSFQYLSVNKITAKQDLFYLNYPGTGAYHGEATTIWVAGDAGKYPKKSLEIISGKGKIENFKKKTGFHSFNTVSDGELAILDNTVYFPGWTVMIDNINTPIEFQDTNHRGLITFKVPKGEHFIEVFFRETKIRLFADIISLLTVVFILLYFLVKKLKK
jgi:uncharacterized membrane protein